MPRAERALGLAALAFATGAAPPPERATIAWVIDGDTFRLSSGAKIRVAGIDAPESARRNARCASEVALGKAATRRAVTLLKGRTVEIERVGRSYDRIVARVRMDGRDVAAVLVDAGVARWWPRGRTKPDWCEGPSA